jgi:hypothetical protein
MKNFYVTPVVLFVTTILFSCSKVPKEEHHAEEVPSFLQLPPSADARLISLIDSIRYNKHHRSVINSALSKFGFLCWMNGVIGHRGSTLVAIIPLSLPNAGKVSGFIAFEMDSLLRLKVYDASRPYGNGVSARSVTNVINALNFKVFGVSLARIDDPCAMSRREAAFLNSARSADPSRKIQLNVRTIEVTTCYSWVSCIGDGAGNCVSNITYHSDCITDVIWTAGEYEEPWVYQAGEDLSGDGGSGGGYNNVPCEGEEVEEGMEVFVVYEPEKPIENINDYVDCFTSSKSARITFYADAPVNGSAVKFSKYEKAGHTFLTIEQNINNTIFRRTLGFYPDEAIDPVFITSGPSILGDNSNNAYDVKLSVNVTGLQLEKVLNLIRKFNPIYDLQRYNCTNFVLDVSDAAGLSIKRTVASWGIGSGLNPTNFGEDLKLIPGAVIGAGSSHANIGNCQ